MQQSGMMSQTQRNWSPATRLLSGVGGSLLTLYGLTRKGVAKPVLSTAGLVLTARGAWTDAVAGIDVQLFDPARHASMDMRQATFVWRDDYRMTATRAHRLELHCLELHAKLCQL